MSHTIFQIGTVAIMIKNPNGRILGFTLPEGGKVPEEFKEGDEVEIAVCSAHPALIEMGHNTGYYDIKHLSSGRILRTFHKDDEWQIWI
jgi:hypothetical protein